MLKTLRLCKLSAAGKSILVTVSCSFCSSLFITWNKEYRTGDTRLRGCIGTLEPKPLRAALQEYALTSALRDRRFPPVSRKELAALHCTVSLLSAFEHAAGWQDWQIGTHGLIIEFADTLTGLTRTSTFLPEVAAHERWDQQQTIDALVRKSGYVGTVSPEIRGRLKVIRYQSTTASLSHAQYLLRLGSRPLGANCMPVPEPTVVAVPA